MKHACKFVTAVHESIRFIPHAFQIFENAAVELLWRMEFLWRKSVSLPSFVSIVSKSYIVKERYEQHLVDIYLIVLCELVEFLPLSLSDFQPMIFSIIHEIIINVKPVKY